MNVRVHERRQQIAVPGDAIADIQDACLGQLPAAAKIINTVYSQRIAATCIAYDVPVSHLGCGISLIGPGFDNQRVW